MLPKPLQLLVLMCLPLALLACAGGDDNEGLSGNFFFQYSVDGAPAQRIGIDVTGPDYDIMTWYNTTDDETTVVALLEPDGADGYDKVFEFTFPGMNTGAQSVTLVEYWFNDGTNTNYVHPSSESSAALTISAYGEQAQPITGEFDFKLCVDATATCKNISGSFSLLRQPDRPIAIP